jgi:hypothetical protein
LILGVSDFVLSIGASGFVQAQDVPADPPNKKKYKPQLTPLKRLSLHHHLWVVKNSIFIVPAWQKSSSRSCKKSPAFSNLLPSPKPIQGKSWNRMVLPFRLDESLKPMEFWGFSVAFKGILKVQAKWLCMCGSSV